MFKRIGQQQAIRLGTSTIHQTTKFGQQLPFLIQRANYILPKVKKENVVNVYTPTSRLVPKGSSPILEVQKQFYEKYDADGSKRELFNPQNENRIRPGDVIRVTKSDGYSFVGVLIAINKRHLSTNILLRTKISGVGVENRVSVFNPSVSKVEVLRVPAKRWKRSKLYFIRENTKLDVGDVDAEIRKAERRRI